MDGTWGGQGMGSSGFSSKHDADADVEYNVRASRSRDFHPTLVRTPCCWYKSDIRKESLSLCLFACFDSPPSWEEPADRKLKDEAEFFRIVEKDFCCLKSCRFRPVDVGAVCADARLFRRTFSRVSAESVVGSLFLRDWRGIWWTPAAVNLSFLITSSSGVAKTPILPFPGR